MKIITSYELLNADNIERCKLCINIIQGKSKFKGDLEDMGKIDVIKTRVKEILENFPSTRDNDDLLYVIYLKTYYYCEFNEDTFINFKELGLPSFKSIERARRKIQNEDNIYKSSEDTEAERIQSEKYYRKEFGNYGRRY